MSFIFSSRDCSFLRTVLETSAQSALLDSVSRVTTLFARARSKALPRMPRSVVSRCATFGAVVFAHLASSACIPQTAPDPRRRESTLLPPNNTTKPRSNDCETRNLQKGELVCFIKGFWQPVIARYPNRSFSSMTDSDKFLTMSANSMAAEIAHESVELAQVSGVDRSH